jgi:hypothetical protein
MQMVRTQVQLSEQQVRRLRSFAAEKKLSLAEIIRRAVDRFFEDTPAVNRADRRQAAINAAGRFGSGRRDVSRKHDTYLAEDFGK